ncbi:MAG: sensor histidine kinase [Saprospiraceae bacterium]
MISSKQQVAKVKEEEARKYSAFNMRSLPFWRQLVIASVVVSSISLFMFFLSSKTISFSKEAAEELAFGISIGVSLWLSMGYLNSWIAPKVDWLGKPWQAFLIVLPANVLVAVLALATVRFTFVVIVFGQSIEKWVDQEGVGNYFISVLIGLFISAVYQGAWFIRLWKQGIVEREQLKTSQAAAQYEALNAQVNPHFLFNSLNVLSNLVRTNPEKAEDFIQGLSHVYRYVLDIRKEESVSLATEVEALSNYTELVKTRFGERIQVNDQLSPKLQAGEWSDRKIIPLALQMLVENAVKHNGATQSNPLHIKLYEENDWIVITNNRPPRYEESDGKGVGLTNIQERYQLVANQEIVIEDTAESYTVKLPLL